MSHICWTDRFNRIAVVGVFHPESLGCWSPMIQRHISKGWVESPSAVDISLNQPVRKPGYGKPPNFVVSFCKPEFDSSEGNAWMVTQYLKPWCWYKLNLLFLGTPEHRFHPYSSTFIPVSNHIIPFLNHMKPNIYPIVKPYQSIWDPIWSQQQIIFIPFQNTTQKKSHGEIPKKKSPWPRPERSFAQVIETKSWPRLKKPVKPELQTARWGIESDGRMWGWKRWRIDCS